MIIYRIAALAALALSFVLAGCGGREAHPIATTNLGDATMDCGAIDREIAANNENIRATLHEKHTGQAKNAALGAAGIVFFPAWFFMDPKSPERKELDAYRTRNQVLASLAAQKKCQVRQGVQVEEQPPQKTAKTRHAKAGPAAPKSASAAK